MNNVTEELVKSEIQDGLKQVDEMFKLTEFTCYYDSLNRHHSVHFTATNDDETVETTVSY